MMNEISRDKISTNLIGMYLVINHHVKELCNPINLTKFLIQKTSTRSLYEMDAKRIIRIYYKLSNLLQTHQLYLNRQLKVYLF